MVLTGTRRLRQGGHDPRYRTSAAFALAVGFNFLLVRVFTFLPSKERNSLAFAEEGLGSKETTDE